MYVDDNDDDDDEEDDDDHKDDDNDDDHDAYRHTASEEPEFIANLYAIEPGGESRKPRRLSLCY